MEIPCPEFRLSLPALRMGSLREQNRTGLATMLFNSSSNGFYLPAHSIQRFKKVMRVILDPVSPQKLDIFVLETPSRMMAFLIADVVNDSFELRVTGKRTPQSLPASKSAPLPIRSD